jgi:hypothetical protein
VKESDANWLSFSPPPHTPLIRPPHRSRANFLLHERLPGGICFYPGIRPIIPIAATADATPFVDASPEGELSALQLCLGELRPQDRELLRVRYATATSIEDYASQQNRPPGTVRALAPDERSTFRRELPPAVETLLVENFENGVVEDEPDQQELPAGWQKSAGAFNGTFSPGGRRALVHR